MMRLQLNLFRSGLAACVCLCLAAGCSKYGEVSMPTYEHAQALFSACNLKDESRLTAVEESIQAAVRENRISSAEREHLLDIIADARGDNWSEASRKSRLLMMEQVQ